MSLEVPCSVHTIQHVSIQDLTQIFCVKNLYYDIQKEFRQKKILSATINLHDCRIVSIRLLNFLWNFK